MDNHIPARLRNKFWIVFSTLFFFWYVMLYGYDWSTFPGLASVSRQQEKPLQSLDSNPIKSNDSNTKENVTQLNQISINSTADQVPVSTNISSTDQNEEIENNQLSINSTTDQDPIPTNITSTDQNDEIEDLESLQNELDPMFPKDEEQEDYPPSKNGKQAKPCTNRYIYVHQLGSKYNDDLIKHCDLLNKWYNMCPYFDNSGLGQALGNPQRLFLPSGWYSTNQFSLEVIFHQRMKQYDCLTNDSSQASAIFVPYYAGLDVSRYLWDYYNTSIRDSDSLELFKWLREKPEWDVMNGKDHFLVTGRISWDFRRAVDEDSAWGNKIMNLPESQNMTMLTIESSPWHKNDFAIPYPTYFHPSTDEQIRQWQSKMRKQKRRSLFCFAGAPRPGMDNSIRGEIFEQCSSASRKRCKMLECKDDTQNCLNPVNVMKMFQSSIFCLQPSGDSFTRRSTFDSIVAGCIPVFFSPASAYVQYIWHLPKDYKSYSVLIPESDVKKKKVSIEKVLSKISKSKVMGMRNEVINLIPKVVYADPRSRLQGFEDAFDLTVKGVLGRVEELKREMSERRNSSDEFDEESSWKYYSFGSTQKHEWDHYFDRANRMKS